MFSEEEIQQAKSAMEKRGPQQALELIASGRAVIEVTNNGKTVYIDSLDGKKVRDPDFPGQKMSLAGAWPLFAAGMIDQFGLITEAGRDLLSQQHNQTSQ